MPENKDIKCPYCNSEIKTEIEIEFLGWNGKCFDCVWNEVESDD